MTEVDVERLLAELAAEPRPEPPDELVRRWHAAIDQLPPPARTDDPDPVIREATARGRRRPAGRRRWANVWRPGPAATRRRRGTATGWRPSSGPARWVAALAVASAAAVLVLGRADAGPATAAGGHSQTPGFAPTVPGGPAAGLPTGLLADPRTGSTTLTMSRKDLPLGGQDYGPLSDPGRRAGCLAHLGAPGAAVLGGRQTVHDGRRGVLLVLATDTPGRLRALLVTADCAAGSGTALLDSVVGR